MHLSTFWISMKYLRVKEVPTGGGPASEDVSVTIVAIILDIHSDTVNLPVARGPKSTNNPEQATRDMLVLF